MKSFQSIRCIVILAIFYCSSIQAGPLIFQETVVGIRLNNGQKITNNTEIVVEVKSLKLEDKMVGEMQIGLRPDLSDSQWKPYSTSPQKLILSSGDGIKNVYTRLKDKAGNISAIESAQIILDTAPPDNCSLKINNGDKYATDRQLRVALTLNAVDAAKMRISNSENFDKAVWENYAPTKSWFLAPPGDGEKKVFAQFMDAAQNESPIVSASILLDTQGPKDGTVVINGDEKFTRDRLVKVKIASTDAEKALLTDRAGKTEIWEFEGKTSLEKEWEFDSIQGLKSIKAIFMDQAGNKSPVAISDEIIYDSQGPPVPIVQINNNAKFTNHPDGRVGLKIASRVAPATIKMQVSNSPEFADAEIANFLPAIDNWQLENSRDGLKSVYVRFFDEAGNASAFAKVDITLDRKKPIIRKAEINGGAKWTVSSKVRIDIDAEDAAFLQLGTNENVFRSTIWEPYKNELNQYQLPVGDGEKIIYLRAKDEADNISEAVQAKIILDTKPPAGEIIINNKSKYTNSKDKKALVRIDFGDASEMQIGDTPDFSNVDWQPVKREIPGYPLPGEDGIKTIYLRLKDEAGNVSGPMSAQIILDREPPSNCRVLVNNGARWLGTPSKRATLSLVQKEASEMIIGHAPDFADSKWMPVRPLMGWMFQGNDGLKKVYAKFRDEAGNESEVVEASIILDTKAPALEKFLIDNGAQFTNHRELKTSITIKSGDSHFMALDNKPFEKPDAIVWKPFAEQSEWALEGDDGAKTVFLMLKDSAGNISPPFTANIILDRTQPSGGRIIINNNEKFVNHPEKKVSLLISASASEMMISNNADFSGAKWEPIQVRKDGWALPGDDGEKVVYARFKDEAGNISEPVMDQIALDRMPPADNFIVINEDSAFTTRKDRVVRVRLRSMEAKSMIISQDKNFADTRWEDFQVQKEFVLKGEDGEKEIFAKFRDEAGNESLPVSDKIILSILPPKPVRFTINNGEEWCNAKDKKVLLNIEAIGADEMMISSSPDFADGQWKPYARQIEYILPGEDGEKQVFVKFRNKAGNISSPISSAVKLKRTF